ncbi:hypothetical protein EDD85DRAFT_797089 [Armillaria nabsnona]|nr:hypothetical protein EDD85DRAFT_797089 [Armillaria nabsnona]
MEAGNRYELERGEQIAPADSDARQSHCPASLPSVMRFLYRGGRHPYAPATSSVQPKHIPICDNQELRASRHIPAPSLVSQHMTGRVSTPGTFDAKKRVKITRKDCRATVLYHKRFQANASGIRITENLAFFEMEMVKNALGTDSPSPIVAAFFNMSSRMASRDCIEKTSKALCTGTASLVDQIAEIDSAEAKWQECLQDPEQAEYSR